MVTALIYFRSTDPAAFPSRLGEHAGSFVSAPGYLRHELKRGVEDPSRFLLLVEWESVEHHGEWQRAHGGAFLEGMGPHMTSPPEISHFA